MPGLDTHTVRPSSPSLSSCAPCERLPNSEQQWTHHLLRPCSQKRGHVVTFSLLIFFSLIEWAIAAYLVNTCEPSSPRSPRSPHPASAVMAAAFLIETWGPRLRATQR